MTSNVKMILDEVNARIKLAEAKTAEDPSNFDAFPGAENDQAVPAETKKPDPEVKEEGPASRTEVDGAKPGSDVPLQQDHLYEADEPVLTPEKKPADSADAEAKEASAKVNSNVEKVAAEILSIIKGAINKKAADEATAATPAATAPAAEAPAEAPTKDTDGEKEAGCCGAKKCKKVKKAEDSINLGKKILDKIASIKAAKQAGVADAEAILKAAADYNRGAADARALIQKVAQALEESANSAEDATCGDAGCTVEDPAAAGAADAEAALADAAAMDAGAAEGDVAADDVTPEEVAEAVSELVEEGQISEEEAATLVEQISGGEETAAAEGDVSDEQIAEGIIQAIESGAISEDEAQQLVQELVDAGADESVQDEVAAAGADAAAEAPAAEAPAAVEDPAAAAGAADAEAALADAAAMDAQKQAAAEPSCTSSSGTAAVASKATAVSKNKEKLVSLLKSFAGKAKAHPKTTAGIGLGAAALAGGAYALSKSKKKEKKAEDLTKQAEEEQIAKYQQGFIQKCAEYGADPALVAKYIQARAAGQL